MFLLRKGSPSWGKAQALHSMVEGEDGQSGDLLLCYPNGFWRELDQEEEAEVEQWMYDSEATDDYITHQTQWCELSLARLPVPRTTLKLQGMWIITLPGSKRVVTGFWCVWEKKKNLPSLQKALLPAAPHSLDKAIPKVMVEHSLGKAIPKAIVDHSLQKASLKESLEKAPLVAKLQPKMSWVTWPGVQGLGPEGMQEGALQQAGLKVPDSLKPGKAIDDLDPEVREEAKELQKRLKELTWSPSLPARAMQLEIANVKKKPKELLAEKKEEDEEEEVEEEEDDDEYESDQQPPSENSSSSSHPALTLMYAEEVQRAELEKAKEELAKAQSELKAAQEQLEKKKEKRRRKRTKKREKMRRAKRKQKKSLKRLIYKLWRWKPKKSKPTRMYKWVKQSLRRLKKMMKWKGKNQRMEMEAVEEVAKMEAMEVVMEVKMEVEVALLLTSLHSLKKLHWFWISLQKLHFGRACKSYLKFHPYRTWQFAQVSKKRAAGRCLRWQFLDSLAVFFWVGNINSEFGLHPTKKKQEGNPKTGTSPDLGPPQKNRKGIQKLEPHTQKK